MRLFKPSEDLHSWFLVHPLGHIAWSRWWFSIWFRAKWVPTLAWNTSWEYPYGDKAPFLWWRRIGPEYVHGGLWWFYLCWRWREKP